MYLFEKPLNISSIKAAIMLHLKHLTVNNKKIHYNDSYATATSPGKWVLIGEIFNGLEYLMALIHVQGSLFS